MMDGACHVIGSSFNRETNHQNAFDDVASTIHHLESKDFL